MPDNLGKKYTGFITHNGMLHLYESADDMRAAMIVWGREMSMTAWIERTVIHRKGEPGVTRDFTEAT